MSTVKDIQIESALLERIFFQCEAYINGNNSSLVHKEKRVRHNSSKVNIINVTFNAHNKYRSLLFKRFQSL